MTLLFAASFFIPKMVFASELNQANTAWVLTSTALVLFMTIPGLSLFYGGLVRSKNVLSVLMQCFAITCVVSILWLAGGYSLIFSDGGIWQDWIGGTSKAFLPHINTTDLIGDNWILLPDHVKKDIHAREWEKLINGEWQIIDGKTIWINDFYWLPLNIFI